MAARAGRKIQQESVGRIRKFLRSDFGRNCVHAGALVGSTSLFAGYVYINTWGMDRWISVIELYKHGFPSNPSGELVNRVRQVGQDMGLRERLVDAVKVFHVYGFEPTIIGSFKTTHGIALGLPKHFEYKVGQDVEKKDILIEQKPVKWETEEGINFQNSLLISENAQKFAIAQQLYMGKYMYVFILGGLASTSIGAYTLFTAYANKKFYGFARPPLFRFLLYCVTGTFCYGFWSTSRDLYNKFLERTADKKAASLNVDYAKGAVEYYAKLIQRNIALRELMGPTGEKLFTPVGNIKQSFRQRYIPLTVRKENAEKVVERLIAEQSVGKSSENNNELLS